MKTNNEKFVFEGSLRFFFFLKKGNIKAFVTYQIFTNDHVLIDFIG